MVMGSVPLRPWLCSVALSTSAAAAPSWAQEAVPDDAALRAQIAEHAGKLQRLQQLLEEEQASLRALQVRLSPPSGAQPPAAASTAGPAQATNSPPVVGTRPDSAESTPPMATIFEQPSVLTPRGHYVLEPSLQYSYASNDRVALVGYTIIPALVIGLIDVREVKRNTLTAALTARYGLTSRLELEARLPYVYRADDTVSREVATGSATDKVFAARGHDIGDAEFAARYQFTDGGADRPYLVGSLRVKSRTGRDPFQVVTDCLTRCVGNTTGTGLPLQLPTGSGFYSLQPGLTWLLPSDPAVFFGGFTWQHSLARNVSRTVLGGEQEPLGRVQPGDVLGFNVGMGLALNDRASFSLGYDHASVGVTRQNGTAVPGTVRSALGTLLLGYSYRLNEHTTVNFAVGAGLTRDTPDVTLTLRLPFAR
jgi:predicted secreted protein